MHDGLVKEKDADGGQDLPVGVKISSVECDFGTGRLVSFPVSQDSQTQEMVAQCLPRDSRQGVGSSFRSRPEVMVVANNTFRKQAAFRRSRDRKLRLAFQKHVRNDCDLSFYDGNSLNIRRYSNNLYEWIARESAVFVLGLGLIDCGIDLKLNAPKIGPDEFEIRMSWVVGKLIRETRSRIVWVYAPLTADSLDKTGNLRLSVERDREYAEIARRICERERIPFIKAPPTDSAYKVDPEAFFAAVSSAVSKALSEGPASQVASTPLAGGPPKRNGVARCIVTYSDGSSTEIATPEEATLFAARLNDYRGEGVISTTRVPSSHMSLQVPGGRKPFEQSRQQQIVDWLKREERPGLKRAMVLGDSVFMRLQSTTGYCIPCYERLVGSFNLTHVPHHIGGSRSVAANMEKWLGCNPSIVHLNCGLHDLTTLPNGARFPAHLPIPDYVENLQRIIDMLRECKVEHVIWGTCTPLNEDMYQAKIVRRMEDIKRYNDAAVEVMNKNNIEINDLFHPLLEDNGLQKNYQKDGGHLNKHGSELLARIVATKILRYT